MKTLLAAVLSVALLSPALAQSSGLSDKVRSALTSIANGSCPESLLTPSLRASCDGQPQTSAHLRSLGAIETVQSYGVQEMPNGGKPTVFRVIFLKGTMTWYAEESRDGKLSVLWSDGQTQPR